MLNVCNKITDVYAFHIQKVILALGKVPIQGIGIHRLLNK
jgi:hypothetical protein